MLHSNSKLVKARIQAHILDNFAPENYDSESSDPIANLRDQIIAMNYGNKTPYQTALDYMEGGGILIYYNDVRDFLQATFEQTNEQANKYDDAIVWRTYCHLCALQMAHLYTEGK